MSQVTSHKSQAQLIVALDVDSLPEAENFVKQLYPTVEHFKIGSQLFTACGPRSVETVGQRGAKVFLDLKFNDIQRTMFKAVACGTGIRHVPFSVPGAKTAEEKYRGVVQYPVFMMTVHASASKTDLEGAVKGARNKAEELRIKPPYIVGVTVLTSEETSEELVLERARKARDAGLNGVVCSVNEAAAVREEFGTDFIIVTPGIRPKNYPSDDQKRTATAVEAALAGANYIVVGRPILKANDPRKVAEEIIADCKG